MVTQAYRKIRGLSSCPGWCKISRRPYCPETPSAQSLQDRQAAPDQAITQPRDGRN